jgi:hypothetical protein
MLTKSRREKEGIEENSSRESRTRIEWSGPEWGSSEGGALSETFFYSFIKYFEEG